eukprot:gnl/Dysnectes_brevis/6460_a10041_473.p1 GENE.gnl/Dysnectes_brevis/6460_a10041_473~~gnl/Dysnectes_brevis/6460_a10041_473.p1  ORF type:complete len:242 (-),score=28.56 gnl/Dysnectes_brevis/6460_a10041_473:91-816(-)
MFLFYFLRVPFNAVLSALGKKQNPLSSFTWKSRVHLTDIDHNLHMNNTRYFLSMELARYDYLIRSGSLSALLKSRTVPLLAGGNVRWRKELPIGSSYSIESNIAYWDDHWLYLHQKFLKHGTDDVAAAAMFRLAFRQKGQVVSPAGVVADAVLSVAERDEVTQSFLLDHLGGLDRDTLEQWSTYDNVTRSLRGDKHSRRYAGLPAERLVHRFSQGDAATWEMAFWPGWSSGRGRGRDEEDE